MPIKWIYGLLSIRLIKSQGWYQVGGYESLDELASWRPRTRTIARMSEATTVDNQPVPSRAKTKIFVTWGRRTGHFTEDSTVYGHCIEMYYFI